jgi:hypothetical protein
MSDEFSMLINLQSELSFKWISDARYCLNCDEEKSKRFDESSEDEKDETMSV